jgi:hypothetical protein
VASPRGQLLDPLRTSLDLAKGASPSTCAGLEVGTDAGGPKPLSLALRSIYLANTQRRFFWGRLSVQLLLVRRPIGEMVFVATLAATRENRGKLMVTDFVTYLSFDGRCEEAFKRYEKVFKGKIAMMMRHSDAPPGSGVPQNSRCKA